MEIKSDKENKQNPSAFSKVWNYIAKDGWRTLSLLFTPAFLFLWYVWFPEDYVWLLIMGGVATFIVGLMTEGQLFGSIRDTLLVFFVFVFFVSGMFMMLTPTETETDSMDMKPYIVEIKANNKKDTFVMKNKLPFESGIEFMFTGNSQFNALFVNKEYFNDFRITVVKECSKYRIKNTSCDVTLKITHKDMGEALLTKTLYNSVYPKKLILETASN